MAALSRQHHYVFLGSDNAISLPNTELWLHQLFAQWDYLPANVDRDRYIQLAQPTRAASENSSTSSITLPATQTSSSNGSEPTLVSGNPTIAKELSYDSEFERSLTQFEHVDRMDVTLPSPPPRSDTPDSMPELMYPSPESDEEFALHFQGKFPPILLSNEVEHALQNIQYTESWVDKTLITRDRWSSSSLDSTSENSDNLDIPPYDDELMYPPSGTSSAVLPQEPIMVGALFLASDTVEPSEPPTPAPITEDDIPGLQALPRRDSDDDGAGAMTLPMSMHSPKEHDAALKWTECPSECGVDGGEHSVDDGKHGVEGGVEGGDEGARGRRGEEGKATSRRWRWYENKKHLELRHAFPRC
ncbi:hypothetical protein B0H11DRAFT_2278792 [Mycena galericulata]|nr:hypothetical protein B0H11DRAFT_2278792 [Mycena galericulata]